MSQHPLRLAVIIGSNREGRFAPVVARWLVREIERRNDFEVDVIDLVDIELPSVFPQHAGPAIRAYAERIDRADAYVVVTPEYNHGYPAALKQAIDLVHTEWRDKPVGFVSYGGVSGGLRAVEQLRQVFAELHVVSVRDTVSFHMAWQLFDESGEVRDPTPCSQAATTMLDDLAWWGQALRAARAADGAVRKDDAA